MYRGPDGHKKVPNLLRFGVFWWYTEKRRNDRPTLHMPTEVNPPSSK